MAISQRVAANENISINITSNISLIDDFTAGIYGAPLPSTRTYLFEGESIWFDVLVTIPSGLENFATVDYGLGPKPDVFVSLDGQKEAYCLPDMVISNISQKFRCDMFVETPDLMRGIGLIEARARTIQGDEVSTYVGEWFFNPAIAVNYQGNLDFHNVLPGTSVYSNPIVVTDGSEANAPMLMFISGTDFYDSSGSSAACPSNNFLSLSNLSYFAQKGNYSTLNDPRADANGFVPIKYGSLFNSGIIFYGNNEIIQAQGINSCTPNCVTTYPQDLLNHDENMTLIFRLNTPLPCYGNFDVGNVFLWGASGEGYGPAAGESLGLHFSTIREVNVSLMGNVSYLNQSGSSFNPQTIFDEGNVVRFLKQGEKISLNVDVYTPNGIQKIDSVHLTAGANAQFGNDWKSICVKTQTISNVEAIYHCEYLTEDPNIIFGLYNVGIDALTIDGQTDYAWLGLYYFNTDAVCFSGSECNDGNSYTQDSCVNPGYHNAYCAHDTIQCLSNLDCDDSNSLTLDVCINPGTVSSLCQHQSVVCNTNSDCGTDGFSGSVFCSVNNVVKNYTAWTCNNGGTVSSYCSSNTTQQLIQQCSSCSAGQCIDSAPFLDLIINSPTIGIYSDKKIYFNMTTTEMVDKIEFINYAENNPKYKKLCINCNEYGFSNKKFENLKIGTNKLRFRAVKDNNIKEKAVTIVVNK